MAFSSSKNALFPPCMTSNPSRVWQSVSLLSLFGFLLTSPVDAKADQAADIASILNIISSWNQAGLAADFPYMWPYGPTIGEFLLYYFETGPNGVPTFWDNMAPILSPALTNDLSSLRLTLEDIYPLLVAGSTNAVDLSAVESGLADVTNGLHSLGSSQNAVELILQGFSYPIEYDLPHMHDDVEQILGILQDQEGSRVDYQFEVTNNLSSIYGELHDLGVQLQDAFFGSADPGVSQPSYPSDPSNPTMPPTPSDQVYAHTVSMDLDNTQVRVDHSARISSSRYFSLWNSVSFGGNALPDAQVDLADSQIHAAGQRMALICDTVYWLMYYLAIFWLVRREYTYYASLGHSQEAVG